MKTLNSILLFVLFLLAGNIYGQTVLIRPGTSIGYCSADDMKGLSYTYGLKIHFMANEFQRYGIKIDHLNIMANEKKSYLSTGIFIEQVLFNYFNMGIGTVGYINIIELGENPFGLYTHLGFEHNFTKWFGMVTAYKSEFIFRKAFTMNNAFSLEIALRL